MSKIIKKYNNVNKKPWLEPLLNYFSSMKDFNNKIENIRMQLCEQTNFNPFKLFIYLDSDRNGFITTKIINKFLEEKKYYYDDEIIRCLIQTYDKDRDYCLNFQEFLNIILPINNNSLKKKLLLLPKEKQDKQNTNINNIISNEINLTFCKLLKEELDFIKDSLNLIKKIYNSPKFTTYDVFIDIVKNESYITKQNLDMFFKENNFKLYQEKDLEMIMFRIDADNDNRISYLEFQDIFYSLKNIREKNFNSNKVNSINHKEKENINKEFINFENNKKENIKKENIIKEGNSENVLNYNYDIYAYNSNNTNQKYKILNNNYYKYYIKKDDKKKLNKSYSQQNIIKESNNLDKIQINKNIENNNKVNKKEEQKNSDEIERKNHEILNIKEFIIKNKLKNEQNIKANYKNIESLNSMTDRTYIIKSDFNLEKNISTKEKKENIIINNELKKDESIENKTFENNIKSKLQFSNLKSQKCFHFSIKKKNKNTNKYLIKNFSDIQFKKLKNNKYTSMTERILNASQKKINAEKINKYKLNFNYLNPNSKSKKYKIINETILPPSKSSHNINFTNYFKLKKSDFNDNIKSGIKNNKIFLELLNNYINQDIEFQKLLEKLYQCSDFNLQNFFQTFLCSKKSLSFENEIIKVNDIYNTLKDLNMNNLQQNDIIYIFSKFNIKINKKEDMDNIGIKYDEFCKIMTPEKIPNDFNNKKYQKYFMGFCFRTNRIIRSLFQQIINSEKSNEILRKKLVDNETDNDKIKLKVQNIFNSLKRNKNVGYININDFEVFMGIYGKKLQEFEKNIIMKKFNKSIKENVYYNEFFNEICPKIYNI